jgi:hypothetical protein
MGLDMPKREALIAAAVVGVIAVVLTFGIIIGRQSQSGPRKVAVNPPPERSVEVIPPRPSVPKPTITTRPTTQKMEEIGERVAKGDAAAFAELEANAEYLYRNINYRQDQERVIANLLLMRATYNVIGERAAAGDAKAFEMLKASLGVKQLKSFAPDALAKAAAAGNQQAMEILVHHERFGILQTTAVFALREAAEAGQPGAIEYLVSVIDDPKSRGLWLGASQGLSLAAAKGNAKAQEAMKRYDANMQAFRQSSANTPAPADRSRRAATTAPARRTP